MEIVESGFANYYFLSGKDIYYDNFKEAKELFEAAREEKKENEANIRKVFSALEGNVIVSKINNKKAEVYEL